MNTLIKISKIQFHPKTSTMQSLIFLTTLVFVALVKPAISADNNFQLRIGDTILSSKMAGINSISTVSIENSEKDRSKSTKVTSGVKENTECKLGKQIVDEIHGYKEIVQEIVNYVTVGNFKGKAYDMVAELTDTFGPRMTGTKNLEDAIDWALRKFSEERLENIHTETVENIPHWVRNEESLIMLHPRIAKLSMLGLGSSIGTPASGITAEVLVVKSFDELESKSNQAKGCIVVFNPGWKRYGQSVKYRLFAASQAAKVGAVASLVRSLTPFSINSPHTGWQLYEDSSNKIPTASITVEDAHMLQRMQDKGETIILNLTMGAENLPPTTSKNSVAEVIGFERPEQVVIVSAHLDSWDVGVGAMDDGGGSIISLGATAVLKQLGLRARRTVRTVLFTGEEQGLVGGQAYFKTHSKHKENFQLVLESDFGTFDPKGLHFTGSNYSQCIMQEILSLMEPLNATKLISPMSGGPDIQLWEEAGVPTGSLLSNNSRYFWFHHSAGDTMEIEDSSLLDKCTALWTAIAFVAADLNFTLPHHNNGSL